MADGITLGGGGAKGDFFEVGAVTCLWNRSGSPKVLTGASAGAINAAKLADGGTAAPARLADIWLVPRANSGMWLPEPWSRGPGRAGPIRKPAGDTKRSDSLIQARTSRPVCASSAMQGPLPARRARAPGCRPAGRRSGPPASTTHGGSGTGRRGRRRPMPGAAGSNGIATSPSTYRSCRRTARRSATPAPRCSATRAVRDSSQSLWPQQQRDERRSPAAFSASTWSAAHGFACTAGRQPRANGRRLPRWSGTTTLPAESVLAAPFTRASRRLIGIGRDR
jgi:Patatin-like phospholipase